MVTGQARALELAVPEVAANDANSANSANSAKHAYRDGGGPQDRVTLTAHLTGVLGLVGLGPAAGPLTVVNGT